MYSLSVLDSSAGIGRLTVLLSLSLKLNGSELTEILETGKMESKYCQITVPSPRRAVLRGN